jgi:hypothetical protein
MRRDEIAKATPKALRLSFVACHLLGALQKIPLPARTISSGEPLMSDHSLAARALSLALTGPSPVTAVSPLPPAGAPPSSQAALRKCRAAWQRVMNQELKGTRRESVDHILAAKEAAKAFAGAMPALAGPGGIRDFIACAAHRILIGAIPVDRAGAALYAA